MVLRRRRRLRALSGAECLARLYGNRSRDVVTVPGPADGRSEPGTRADRDRAEGSFLVRTEPLPSLAYRYPRTRARVSGEEIRLALLARMQARSGLTLGSEEVLTPVAGVASAGGKTAPG